MGLLCVCVRAHILLGFPAMQRKLLTGRTQPWPRYRDGGGGGDAASRAGTHFPRNTTAPPATRLMSAFPVRMRAGGWEDSRSRPSNHVRGVLTGPLQPAGRNAVQPNPDEREARCSKPHRKESFFIKSHGGRRKSTFFVMVSTAQRSSFREKQKHEKKGLNFYEKSQNVIKNKQKKTHNSK